MPSPEVKTLHKVALAHFKDKKVMVVRDNKNEKVFILPGGKIEEGESDVECLVRECQEELSVQVKTDTAEHLKDFLGPAHGKPNTFVEIRLYSAEFDGEPKPTEEIVEIDYFDSQTDLSRVSEIGQVTIFPWLKEHGYIN